MVLVQEWDSLEWMDWLDLMVQVGVKIDHRSSVALQLLIFSVEVVDFEE